MAEKFKTKKQTEPILIVTHCPMCENAYSLQVRHSKAKDRGLYVRCVKCGFMGFSHYSVLAYLRRHVFQVKLKAMSRLEFDRLLRSAKYFY